MSNFFNEIQRTDKSDPSLLQILPALEEVVEDAVEPEEHAVDRQVPSVGVELPVLGELDVGLPAVTDHVDAQRGHLEVLAVVDARRHRTVLLAERIDGAHPLRLEHGLHLVGRRCRGKVQVFRGLGGSSINRYYIIINGPKWPKKDSNRV